MVLVSMILDITETRQITIAVYMNPQELKPLLKQQIQTNLDKDTKRIRGDSHLCGQSGWSADDVASFSVAVAPWPGRSSHSWVHANRSHDQCNCDHDHRKAHSTAMVMILLTACI